MASGSPRNRIDQFFPSKKKKSLSPGLKSERYVKEKRTVLDGSPSAKGSLDSFLVNSQDSNRLANSSFADPVVPPRQDTVKRNLTLEINLSSEITHRHAYSETQGQPRTVEVSREEAQREQSQGTSELGNNAVQDCAADTIEPPSPGPDNPEFKKFAADFLSLYCSEVPASVSSVSDPKLNANKRIGSPSLLDAEGKISKKLHCIPKCDQSQLDGEISCGHEEHSEHVKLGFSAKTGVLLQCPGDCEREVGTNPFETHASLRKCDITPKSGINMPLCSTPGALNYMCARETPNSARGSSIFSPGEAFWNEAIQLADGFYAPIDKSSVQTTEVDILKSQVVQDGSCNLRNGCNNGSKESESNARTFEMNSSLGSIKKHTKEKVDYSVLISDKDGSPIPVKHFDFLIEDKISDEKATQQNSDYDMKETKEKGTEKSDGGSVIHRGRQDTNFLTRCAKSEKNELPTSDDELGSSVIKSSKMVTKVSTSPLNEKVYHVQDVTSTSARVESKVGLSNQGSGSVTANATQKDTKRPCTAHCRYDETGTPSSTMPLKACLDLNRWLPSEVCSVYKRKGISRLYPWQVDCLQVDGVLQNKNLVYCASTSAGKSFVAEILMLRRLFSSGKIALLVLPYVSICSEKAEHLEVLLEPLGKHVRSFYGNQGGGTLPKDTSVAVCTIEKANSLVNRLLEEGRLSEVGIIVIDELHMVGDQNRGYLLELLLTKLRYAAGEGSVDSCSGESSGSSSGKADPAHGLQIVGMSATMPNVSAVADWLQAALYETDFRPVPLEEYIKVGNAIFDRKMNIVRTIPKAADLGGKDPDHVVELCNEVVQDGHSVLLFCSSRKGCESTARHVSKFLKKFSSSKLDDQSAFIDIASAIDALRRCPAGLDPVLEETLPTGVAYHHAGLTVEEREIVETCYRRGLVRVLTATSTLAAGVNLPARRVIFRQPRIGRDFIDGTKYRQMAGRAGRTGIDTKGESILICKAEEVKRITTILNDCCPPLQSCLAEDKNGMTHAILEVVAGGIVQTASDIHRYVRCTLLNSTKPFQDVVKSAQDSLRWLCHRKFLEWNEETKLYSTTPLGRAAFGSSLSPEESLVVLDDLARAREGFVLASDLHVVYLVTPINVDVEPDWKLYYERFMEVSPLDQSVGNRVGVVEPFLMRMAHGVPINASNKSRNKKGIHNGSRSGVISRNNNMLSDEQMLRICKRFYVALILSRLVQETPVTDVCEAFKVARGMVQALQENAGRFASMVSSFCERLGWHDLEGLVAKFQNRVSFGVRAEIVELTTIPFVKGSRARALYKAGLRTPQAIAEASLPEIAKALFESSTWAAKGSAQRHIQMGVARKIKNGACKIVLEKGEEARIAAFSAFRSLGLNVPQFSLPIVSTTTGSLLVREGEMISSGDDTNSSFAGGQSIKDTSTELAAEKGKKFDSGVAKTEGEELKRVSDLSSGTTMEVDSTVGMQFCSGAGNLEVTHEGLGLALGNKVRSSINCGKEPDEPNSTLLGNTGNSNRILGGYLDHENHNSNRQGGNACHYTTDNIYDKGPTGASNSSGGFDGFLDLLDTIREFYFDIHFTKRSGLNSIVPFEIHGMAICWENSRVYYINISKDLMGSDKLSSNGESDVSRNAHSDPSNIGAANNRWEMAKHRWNRIARIMGKSHVRKICWNLKVQIQVLKYPGISIQRFGGLSCVQNAVDIELIDSSYFLLSPIYVQDGIDMCLITWILWPDEERSSNPNIEKEVKKRLSSEAAEAANRSGRWKNQMRKAAHNGCCRRAAQTRALSSVLWKLLISEELDEALVSIETPLVSVLADMELWGIGVDMEGCLRARNVLVRTLKELEKEAYKLSGVRFSLYTASDIANVLYQHLKLPIPEGTTKGKRHPSTDKHSLDLLR
ncbi:helicase and polymerase-containing protein TEBICHI isoform X2 [Macadamia integrifolia]|nr:helicase and polymerase-containing protein TEBICHI isoform X2 [Macadamia integrifolia]